MSPLSIRLQSGMQKAPAECMNADLNITGKEAAECHVCFIISWFYYHFYIITGQVDYSWPTKEYAVLISTQEEFQLHIWSISV